MAKAKVAKKPVAKKGKYFSILYWHGSLAAKRDPPQHSLTPGQHAPRHGLARQCTATAAEARTLDWTF